MNQETRNGKVFFIGAGPGAADLITLRGKKIIDKSDCIIYAGSLVNKELFAMSKADIYDSSGLNLDQISISSGEVSNKVASLPGYIQEIHPCMVQPRSRWCAWKH